MITGHPWFGPHSGYSWGWTPVSWEGVAVIILWFIAFAAAYYYLGKTRRFAYSCIGLVAMLLLVCALTGLPPG
jgi:hypothetical protein